MKRAIQVLTALIIILFANVSNVKSQEITDNPSISDHRLKLVFNEGTRTYELYDAADGLILSAGMISYTNGHDSISTNDPDISRTIQNATENKLVIGFNNSFKVVAELQGDSVLIFKAVGEFPGEFFMNARAPLSDRTMAAMLINEKTNDRQTLIQSLGKTEIPGQKSIFDPLKDLAVQIESEGKAAWDYFYQWQLKASAKSGENLCTIKLIRHYYRDDLGITYYAPVKKRSYFEKAPALAMTWVGIEGKYNRPDFAQRKEWLYPNIDWVSKNLLPYAGEMVFQLDDNYPIDDPKYMRDISDYIRSKGLIPGIWMAPFSVAPYKETETHPEWFIHKADGSPVITFSGLSYDDVRHYNSAVLNVNNKGAVEHWFAGFVRQISETWNYDYFKIDGIPAVLSAYKRSVDGEGVDGVRRGLHIIRSVLGPDKYINTSWGIPLEGIDIVNGSRVGGDTEQEDQVISRVAVKQNYLNNVAWYSDPDGAANMYASTVSRARLNFLGRSLLGQPYVTDDHWTKVPDKILEVWQKTLPTIESIPANLYKINDPEKYDHFDLKITKPWGSWDVVALNNYAKEDLRKSLDLRRLALTSDQVYVFDFWNQKYLGKFSRNDTIERNMKAIDAHCFNIVPVRTDRPVLLSTNRHYTQGGIDIEKMSYTKKGSEWIIQGESGKLICQQPYEMTFQTNGYTLEMASASDGITTIIRRNGIAKVRIIPEQTKTVWLLSFKPDDNTSVSFGSELVQTAPGKTVEIPVNLIHGPAHWKIRKNDRNIKIKENHRESSFSFEINPDVLEPEQTWSTWLTLESKDANVYTDSLLVEVQGPDRINIAPEAKASASSIYFWGDQNGYGRPDGVNDGLSFKAWEAAEGDTSGWVELIWKKPVTFQRIVIDEWMESGGHIRSWYLEAGYKTYQYTPRRQTKPVIVYKPDKEFMNIISEGKTIGRNFVIILDKPVTANALRLYINKASKRPGIWEIEVNPADQTK